MLENSRIWQNMNLQKSKLQLFKSWGVTPSKFYKTHIPINSSNIYIAETSETLNRLSQAIAVDVYTSGNGKERLRSCYDSLRELNKHGKLGDVEPYLRQLNERVQYYLGILCGTIKPVESRHVTPPATPKKAKVNRHMTKQQANAVKAQQRAKAMFESRLHAYTPDSQFQSQYRSTIASHNLIKEDDYEH